MNPDPHSLLVFAHPDEAQAFEGIPHLVTGIGLVNATTGIAHAARNQSFERVIVLGTAGMIDDTLNLDTVYRVAEAVQHDFAFESPRAFLEASGSVSIIGERRGSALGSEETTANPVDASANDVPTATIASGDAFVTDDALKEDLVQQGIHLVDMESYGYAAACVALGLSLEIYKIPSDFADSATTDADWDAIVRRKSEQLRHFAQTRGLL